MILYPILLGERKEQDVRVMEERNKYLGLAVQIKEDKKEEQRYRINAGGFLKFQYYF